MNLPIIEGVRYIVSWQDHRDTPIPDSLNREDIKIIRYDKSGQSFNRNNAFSHCSADVILCSDDDLIYDPKGLKGIIEIFSNHKELDLATFRSDSRHRNKVFPNTPHKLSIPYPKYYSVACYEIAFRRATAGNLRCHPKFGLGSPAMHGGEDELLLLTAIHRGLNCRYFPLTICAHPNDSTGTKSTMTGKNLRAMGCIIALTYPCSCILRIPLKAWRTYRAGQSSLLKSLWFLTSGALRAPFLFPDKRYLW